MTSCDFLFYVYMSHLSTQFDLLSIRIRKIFYTPADKQLILDFPLAKDSENYFANNNDMTELSTPEEWENKYMSELQDIILTHHRLIR